MLTRTIMATRLVMWPAITLLFLCLAPLPSPAAEAPARDTPGGTVLRVTGAVNHPLAFTLPQLRELPSVEQMWTLDGQSHRARGVDLLALVDRAGLKEDPAVKNHRLRFAVVAKARDGYEAVFSLGELMPTLGGKVVLVAYEEDGQALPARDASLKTVVASDSRPSRSIRGLTELRVVDLISSRQPHAPSHLGD
jgi:DMSO/TMAO reductase YedYZ molybdopterin-dependent catalytic subunit